MDDTNVHDLLEEMATWRGLLDQPAEAEMDVYLDLKSPHAYLAVRPSVEIARDFRVRIHFWPYSLSYREIGVSTSVEPDMQRRPGSPAADRKARMYYAAARQYATLQNLPLRSPYRLLDSQLAHQHFLFAKQQGLELQFAMFVYLHGWSTGWREFELESADELRGALTKVGVQIEGLSEYLAAQGPAEVEQCITRAEQDGAVGVPHYVFTDPQSQQRVGLFGREHLALIRGKFLAAGLARNANVVAQFSHAWRGPSASS